MNQNEDMDRLRERCDTAEKALKIARRQIEISKEIVAT